MTSTADTGTRRNTRASSRSWAALSFRAAAVGVAALVGLQGVLAGGFLSGHYDALAAHATVGGMVMVALIAQIAAALVWWRQAGGPSWTFRVSLIQLGIVAALIILGRERILMLHVPLAVMLSVGVAFSLHQAWRAGSVQRLGRSVR